MTIFFGSEEWNGPLSLFEMMDVSDNLEVSCYDGNVALLKTEPPIILEIGIMYTKPDQMPLAAKRFLASIFCPKK